jgi:GNAT superfamily N-acetyltransferase
VAGGTVIRELLRKDAPAVARLALELNSHQVETAETVWQRASRQIAREQRREWVAELDGEIVGHAQAGFEWSVPTPGKGRFWIGVLLELRGQGVGTALYATVEDYLGARGAWRLRTWVDDDPAGAHFLERREFERAGADRVSALDLPAATLPEPSGHLVPLAEVLDREEDLFRICAAGELDMPGDEPETELTIEDWRQDDFGAPTLSAEGSFVALESGRPVSLAFLSVDPSRRLAYNQMTATLPEFRRRGLALAVKLASARWAAANGYERIVTENDEANVGMLAVNNRLGYRPLYDQVSYVLQWERPPGERG